MFLRSLVHDIQKSVLIYEFPTAKQKSRKRLADFETVKRIVGEYRSSALDYNGSERWCSSEFDRRQGCFIGIIGEYSLERASPGELQTDYECRQQGIES